MLRDALASIPNMATWPCDEINYIWRHGNVAYPSDEYSPEMARADVTRYIRKQFGWVSRKYGVNIVLEKTCANSLRVPFVDRVVPDAKYIYIRRDGLDVVGSAMLRWKAPLDIPYLARKAWFVPLSDLPYYGGRYLGNRIYRIFSGKKRLAFWGPQIDGMSELLTRHSLDEICALQWKRCVDAASGAFYNMPRERWIEVGYEDFVRSPVGELKRVISHLGVDVSNEALRHAVVDVRDSSIGKGRAVLDQETIDRLSLIIGDTQARYSYSS